MLAVSTVGNRGGIYTKGAVDLVASLEWMLGQDKTKPSTHAHSPHSISYIFFFFQNSIAWYFKKSTR